MNNSEPLRQILEFAKGQNLADNRSFIFELDRNVNGDLYFEKPEYVNSVAGGQNRALILNRTGSFVEDAEIRPLIDQVKKALLEKYPVNILNINRKPVLI